MVLHIDTFLHSVQFFSVALRYATFISGQSVFTLRNIFFSVGGNWGAFSTENVLCVVLLHSAVELFVESNIVSDLVTNSVIFGRGFLAG